MNIKADDASLRVWAVNGDELFTNLLGANAQDVNYTFDRAQLKTSGYSPIAHSELEAEQTAIRKLAVKLLSGERTLKMDIEKFPVDPAARSSVTARSTSTFATTPRAKSAASSAAVGHVVAH